MATHTRFTHYLLVKKNGSLHAFISTEESVTLQITDFIGVSAEGKRKYHEQRALGHTSCNQVINYGG